MIMKAIPQIQKFMTTNPHTINADMSLVEAKKMMADLHVRHLPVLHAGKVVGVISERDVALLMALNGVDAHKTNVEQAMTEMPYITTPESPLDQVAMEMSEKRYGSAIVMQNQKVVGIFTAVDGLRALAELLHMKR